MGDDSLFETGFSLPCLRAPHPRVRWRGLRNCCEPGQAHLRPGALGKAALAPGWQFLFCADKMFPKQPAGCLQTPQARSGAFGGAAEWVEEPVSWVSPGRTKESREMTECRTVGSALGSRVSSSPRKRQTSGVPGPQKGREAAVHCSAGRKSKWPSSFSGWINLGRKMKSPLKD